MANLSDEKVKELYKEALMEWLDEKFAIFGKWTLRAFFAALFTAMIYFMLMLNGWHHFQLKGN